MAFKSQCTWLGLNKSRPTNDKKKSETEMSSKTEEATDDSTIF